MIEVATQMPQTREALNASRALPRGFGNSRAGEAILAAVKDGLETDAKLLPALPGVHEKVPESTQAAAEILKLALKIVAEREGLAPRLLASAADIDAVAQDDDADVPLMKGWRRQMFGDRGARSQAWPRRHRLPRWPGRDHAACRKLQAGRRCGRVT